MAEAGFGMAQPWNTALFPSDYLGTDWQFFHGDVREHFTSPYLSREKERESEEKKHNIQASAKPRPHFVNRSSLLR